MKVLHLPSNIASQISVIVRALRDIGVDARGLLKKDSQMLDSRGIEILPAITGSRYSINGILSRSCLWRTVLAAIKWAGRVFLEAKSGSDGLGATVRFQCSSRGCTKTLTQRRRLHKVGRSLEILLSPSPSATENRKQR